MNFFNNIITPLKDWILKWNGKQQFHFWNHIFHFKELFRFIIRYKFSTKTYQQKLKHEYNHQFYFIFGKKDTSNLSNEIHQIIHTSIYD
jgi:tRNA(Leu) C34 or U34 (ribose-2'-O)-methylase TrmL